MAENSDNFDGHPSEKSQWTGVASRQSHDGHAPALRHALVPSPGQTRTDEQLLLDYRSGDYAALETLIVRYQKELFGFLARFLRDKTAAEDVFQETFLQVHQSADQFDVERRFKPWLFTIAANKARDLMRANTRKHTVPLHGNVSNGSADSTEFLSLLAADTEMPDQPLERAELTAKVHSIIDAMPANLREILLLAYFQEFPYKQIADILEIPLGTVKSRLHASVAFFAARWKSSNIAGADSYRQ